MGDLKCPLVGKKQLGLDDLNTVVGSSVLFLFFFTPPHYSAELNTQSVFSSGEGKNFEKGESRGGKLCHAKTSSEKKSKLIRFLLQFISQSRCLTMSV
jgi:hypothetical protein